MPAPSEVGAPAAATAPTALPGTAHLPPIVLVLGGCTSVPFGAALATTLFDDLGPGGTSILRLGWAALILAVLVRPRLRDHSLQALRVVALFGLALGAMNLAFYEALDRIPLGTAVTIEFAGPLAVAVVASRRRLDLVWAALAAVGVMLLTGGVGAGGIDPLGLAFALTAAACWAAYILIAQRAGQLFDGADGVALAMLVAALVPLLPGVLQGGGELLHPGVLAVGAGVALLSSVVPYSLETEALRRLPAQVFGVMMSLEPAIAALAGFLVLGQALGATALAAMGLVVAASIGVSLAPPPLART